jgi:hypothetical protein
MTAGLSPELDFCTVVGGTGGRSVDDRGIEDSVVGGSEEFVVE